VDAMNRLQSLCDKHGFIFVKLPVNNTNEAQLVTAALLHKKIDAFFALPDNVVFSAMEVIIKECDAEKVPVFTSEEGLVKTGSAGGFRRPICINGATRQVNRQRIFFKTNQQQIWHPEIVKVRHRVYNEVKAAQYLLSLTLLLCLLNKKFLV